MKSLVSIGNDGGFASFNFIAVAVRTMDDGLAPTFFKTFYIGKNIFHSGCKNQLFRRELFSGLYTDFKTIFSFLTFRSIGFKEFHGIVMQYLFFGFRSNLSRNSSVLCDEIVRMRGITIARFSAVND